MDTEKAIRVLIMYKYQKTCSESQMRENEELDEIIDLLKEGKENRKYKMIIQELEDEAQARNNIVVPNEYLANQGGVMEYLIKKLKEKYFPKPDFLKEERVFGIDFVDGESITVKMMLIKNPDGRITVSNEIDGHLIDKGGET